MKKKKNISLLAVFVLMLAFCACSKQKPTNDIIAPKPVKEVQKSPAAMPQNHQDRKIDWVGSVYRVVIDRTADKSLPLTMDESGKKYYDNVISVKIIRKDGSEFFNRTFSKDDFAQYVEGKYAKNGALLGIVLDKAEGDNVYFAASVGSPDALSDEYVPMVMTITRMGAVSVKKDNKMDTTSASDEDDYDEDGV